MRVASLVAFRLGAFLAAAGLIYLLTAYEWAGGLLVLLAAVAFTYVGVVLRAAAREVGPAAQTEEELSSPEPVHVGPTIWPFVFSLAAAMLVLGIVVQRWLLIPGSLVFVASAIGWFADVRRQHAHGHPGEGSGRALSGGTSA
jgi:Cytochrome c oxidase subunit IV